MSRRVDKTTERVRKLAEQAVVINERRTCDQYRLTLTFDEKLPEAGLEIVGQKPSHEAIEHFAQSMGDAPYFGVTGDYLKGAEWALRKMREWDGEIE